MKSLKSFFNVLASDFYKLSRMKSLYIGLAVMAVLMLITALAQNALGELINDSEGMTPENAEIIANNYGIIILLGAPTSLGAFFLVPVIVALFIGGDFSTGMARLYAGRGLSKTEIYVSKQIVAFSVALLYVLFAFLAAVAAESALGIDYVGTAVAKSLGGYIFLAFCMSAIYTAVCFLLRSKAGGISVLMAMYIVLGAVLTSILQIAFAMEPTGTESKMVYLHLNPYYLTNALANVSVMTSKELALSMGGMAVWSVIFTAGGLALHIKKDIK